MNVRKLLLLLLVAFVPATAVAAGDGVPKALNIWPGTPPGTEGWTQKEITYPKTPVGTVIINVANPTVTPFLPAPGKATGTAVILAPGGACAAITIEREGYGAARWLQQRGIAAFVLKYRTPEKKQQGIPDTDPDIACKFGTADAIQAVKFVRAHAAQWGIDSHRVGIVGFSAGGMVASGALLQEASADRPNFAAFIYGAPFGKMPAIPQNLPPVFLAWAQDDPLVLDGLVKFYDALQSAGNKPEAHIYSKGGHGFGTQVQGTSSDHWIDEFYFWLQAQRFTTRAK